MSEELEAVEGMAELVKFFGWRRAAEIMGTCLVLALRYRPDELEAFVEGAPSGATVTRLRADCRRFRRYLEGIGKGRLMDVGQEVEQVTALVREAQAM